MQVDPIMAKLYEIFQDLNATESEEVFELTENPMKHHISYELQPQKMYTQLMTRLCKENSQLASQLLSNIRVLDVCMNCGHRET